MCYLYVVPVGLFEAIGRVWTRMASVHVVRGDPATTNPNSVNQVPQLGLTIPAGRFRSVIPGETNR